MRFPFQVRPEPTGVGLFQFYPIGRVSRLRFLFWNMPMKGCFAAAALVLAAQMGGCTRIHSAIGGTSGSSVTRGSNNLVFETDYPIRVFRARDEVSADIYMTDLSDAELRAFFVEDPDWSTITGSIVQIRLFIDPKPGSTPIDQTAVSASVRSIVIAQGEIGVYDGAGFLLPGGSIEDGSIRGSIRGAPIRLTRRTPGFRDPLVSPSFDVRFSVRQDEQASDELDARVDALSAAASPIANPQTP